MLTQRAKRGTEGVRNGCLTRRNGCPSMHTLATLCKGSVCADTDDLAAYYVQRQRKIKTPRRVGSHMIEALLNRIDRHRRLVWALLICGVAASVYYVTRLEILDSPERWMPQSTVEEWKVFDSHFDVGDTVGVGLHFTRPIREDDLPRLARLRSKFERIDGMKQVYDASLVAEKIEAVPLVTLLDPANHERFSLYAGAVGHAAGRSHGPHARHGLRAGVFSRSGNDRGVKRPPPPRGDRGGTDRRVGAKRRRLGPGRRVSRRQQHRHDARAGTPCPRGRLHVLACLDRRGHDQPVFQLSQLADARRRRCCPAAWRFCWCWAGSPPPILPRCPHGG